MNCTCISDIEKKVKQHLIDQGKLKKPVKAVFMQGVILQIVDHGATTRTVNYLEIELEGQKKREQISMTHTFCPFCGVKQGAEA